jgi:hypothetical protein
MKEIKQLGEHGEEANRKITELEALCKQHIEAAQKQREEKANMEGMVESRDELIMGISDEFGYNCMDEDTDKRKIVRMRRTMMIMEETPPHPLLLRYPYSCTTCCRP